MFISYELYQHLDDRDLFDLLNTYFKSFYHFSSRNITEVSYNEDHRNF